MEVYDIIIIGTGAGGGTILHALRESGKNILVLERGKYLPREKENWDTIEVFQKERYHTQEVWKTNGDQDLHPGTGYWVGGNTKVYGAALFRLRERDFEQTRHVDGLSPEWPLKYRDLEPFYTEAEQLFDVHGLAGSDPNEPFRSGPYPYPQISNEPVIESLQGELFKIGRKPFPIPMGIRMDESDPVNSPCIRCNTCDGFPCLVHAKADAEWNVVRPSLGRTNVTLLTEAKVTGLMTDQAGHSISSIEVEHLGVVKQFKADIVILSAGAINSAALLLRSANEQHPNGLANSSGLVGRNLMKHNNAALMGLTLKENPTVFQKTLAVTDFYFGDQDFQYPMGCIQLMGKSNKDMLAGDAPSITPGSVLQGIAEHSIDWWLTGEDLPSTENRVRYADGQIRLDYTENNLGGFNRLKNIWEETLKTIYDKHTFLPHSLYLRKNIPLQGVAHQCGTLRFGNDGRSSVLDIHCRTHDIENLYVVDGSFFPSSAAVNPSLTIIANALRVGKHLVENVL
jgi:choline dehydrogenase-like flavoprotein